RPLTRHSGRFQMATGLVMIAVAVAMLADLDTRFQTAIANDLPGFLVDPSAGLEKTHSTQHALAKLRGHRAPIPVLGRAPEFTGNQDWFNTPGDRPLTMKGLRGHVVLIDFWTYTCINCIRTLPYLKALDAAYRKDGLVIVGLHTPEFPFEKNAANVKRAIEQNGLRYPVVQDNNQATWNAWGNQYWPAEYFVDAQGRVRHTQFGEGNYGEDEHVVRQLLAEAGHAPTAPMTGAHGVSASLDTTPETYLGTLRAPRPPSYLQFIGAWNRTGEYAAAGFGALLHLHFVA